MPDQQQEIAELKRQRGYYAAFGQNQKVKAVDAELAKLRSARETKPTERTKPAADVETAQADTSSVETASVRKGSGRKRG